jgi:hypothetical protein
MCAQQQYGILNVSVAVNLEYKENCNNSIELCNFIKALLLFHNDAHNYKITRILKQLKIPTFAPTSFGSRRESFL